MTADTPSPLVPKLRFPEFKDLPEWDLRTLSSVSDVNPSNEGLPERFIYIDLESVKNSVLTGRTEISRDAAPSRAQRLLSHKDIIYQTVRPYQRNNLFFDTNDGCKYVASTGYAQLRANESPEFLYQLLHTDSFVSSVLARCTGSNYPAINPSALASIEVSLPMKTEQQKIADCLGSLDDLIAAEGQKLEALRQHKQGLMQQLFPQPGETVPRLRFPEFENMPGWALTQLSDVVDYEQPGKYIVENTSYQNAGTPVLTANKSFVLGHTSETDDIYQNVPVIIFDDFTTDAKYVDFPFKVKSSAVKILTPRGEDELRLVYELMSRIRFDSTQHKRYFISQYQYLKIPLPGNPEQQKIADCLGSLDDLIAAESRKLEVLRQHKQGLMQQLFPSLEMQ